MEQDIYLDYNATTPLSQSVIEKIMRSMTCAWGNPSSSHGTGLKAKQLIDEARSHLKEMLNASHENEITFMSGGTEANNHVIYNAIKYFTEHRNNQVDCIPHIITSVIEHDSILEPLNMLVKESKIELTLVGVSKILGHVDPVEIIKHVKDNTVLVTIMMSNNETGAIQPIKEICTCLQKVNNKRHPNLLKVLCHTDAAQSVGKIKVDVKDLGVDYLTVVGHKFYAPRIGALWVRSRFPLYTMIFGGKQENNRRSGTENTCMIAGLGEAARLVKENLQSYTAHFSKVKRYLKDQLLERFNGVTFNEMPCDTLPNTINVSFAFSQLSGHDILKNCNKLQASVGAACHTDSGGSGSAVLIAHGVDEHVAKSSIRLSIGRETSIKDIDIVIDDIKTSLEVNKNAS